MGALQKLKAYFGMVPAEDFEEYDAVDDYGREYAHRPSYLAEEDDYEPYPARRRLFGGLRSGYRNGREDISSEASRRNPSRLRWFGKSDREWSDGASYRSWADVG